MTFLVKMASCILVFALSITSEASELSSPELFETVCSCPSGNDLLSDNHMVSTNELFRNRPPVTDKDHYIEHYIQWFQNIEHEVSTKFEMKSNKSIALKGDQKGKKIALFLASGSSPVWENANGPFQLSADAQRLILLYSRLNFNVVIINVHSAVGFTQAFDKVTAGSIRHLLIFAHGHSKTVQLGKDVLSTEHLLNLLKHHEVAPDATCILNICDAGAFVSSGLNIQEAFMLSFPGRKIFASNSIILDCFGLEFNHHSLDEPSYSDATVSNKGLCLKYQDELNIPDHILKILHWLKDRPFQDRVAFLTLKKDRFTRSDCNIISLISNHRQSEWNKISKDLLNLYFNQKSGLVSRFSRLYQG